jgi:hypothetical protein
VKENRYTKMNGLPIGTKLRLDIEPLANHPNLEKVYLADDLEPDFSLTLYVPKL